MAGSGAVAVGIDLGLGLLEHFLDLGLRQVVYGVRLGVGGFGRIAGEAFGKGLLGFLAAAIEVVGAAPVRRRIEGDISGVLASAKVSRAAKLKTMICAEQRSSARVRAP